MRTFTQPDPSLWPELCRRPLMSAENLSATVQHVLSDVRQNKDEALRRLTLTFDGVKLTELTVPYSEISDSRLKLSADLVTAIDQAYRNILSFHQVQLPSEQSVETMPGVICRRLPRPIESVGLYIPGGAAPLFSTVLMLGVPAQVAGCKEIVLCTPPATDGSIHPAILYAASCCGISRIVKSGGAQAIAAMAYGTESVPQVYKIFGPGNQYVTRAKQLVALDGTAIDLPAGPSEVLVIADRNADPEFVAADLLSQAEHGADSQVVLLADDAGTIAAVQEAVERQLDDLPRKDIARRALQNSLAIALRDLNECITFSNVYAPEHLILNTTNAEELLAQVTSAGSVFLGAYSPESAGDYASGTNHTLPTNGYARAAAGVSVDSFIRQMTVQRITAEGLRKLGPIVETMAQAETLEAHRRAVSIRLAN